MADLAHLEFSWVGNDFDPGVEHSWWFGPISFGDVVYVTAHPVSRISREAMVKDIRVHDDAGWRTLLFTVRNTGVNNISGYGVHISVINN
jgi:hypothetical protein